MENIALTIRNCNNLDKAEVGVQLNKLNIKYGINGTGKSTIVRAIELASSEQGNLNELLPFKHRENPEQENHPNVVGLDDTVTVKVFNEKYVDQFLFKRDEIIDKSFSIFIKTTEYEQKMLEIENLISGIKDTFINDKNLDKVIQDLTELSASFGKSASGMHGAGKLAKAISKGNPLENIPEILTPYRSFLTMPENKNVKWLGWHNKGEEFLEVSDDCPYCTSSSLEKKETIRAIKQEYNPKNIEHLNDIIKIMDSLGHYFAPETHERLQEIMRNKGNISSEQKIYLNGIRPNIEELKTKLTNLKGISFFSFRETEKAEEKINELKIKLSFLPHLESEPSRDIVDRVNKSLEEVEGKIGLLQGQISKQKLGIEKTIQKHTCEINDFLKYAGYKYQVEIIEEENSYKMRLRHEENDGHIENSSMHLSYGERNAFSLVLFMYECLSENPDLIILDDPISSFDKNKKYAVTSKLFRGEESFRGKTVLMVTHDLEPIIDVVHTFYGDFCQLSSASFLENNNGTITELTITKQDIKSFGKVCKDNVARTQDDIIRSIYLRRYYEILDLHGNEYHILSGLLKKRPSPTIDSSGGNLMPQSDVNLATTAIQEFISGFDYDVLIARLNDVEGMYELYENATNNYEKLQLYRIIMQGDSQSDLHENGNVRKFINEAFHIENEYVVQLDPSSYSPVPQYIIDECDLVIGQKRGQSEVQ